MEVEKMNFLILSSSPLTLLLGSIVLEFLRNLQKLANFWRYSMPPTSFRPSPAHYLITGISPWIVLTGIVLSVGFLGVLYQYRSTRSLVQRRELLKAIAPPSWIRKRLVQISFGLFSLLFISWLVTFRTHLPAQQPIVPTTTAMKSSNPPLKSPVVQLYSPVAYRWAHAVNSQDALEAALANSSINAIEADIIFSNEQQLPVMGHPPQVDSSLTLAQFLHILVEARFQGNYKTLVKLDYKSQQAFGASLVEVQTYVTQTKFPQGLFLNADLLLGPMQTLDREQYAPAFIGSTFLELALKTVPEAVWSIGWTTTPHAPDQALAYTEEMVTEMLALLDATQGNTTVTFPIRATSFRSSWSALERLYRANPKYGITLWWSKSQLPREELKWIYSTLEDGPYSGRTYYDILGFEDFLKEDTIKTE